MILFIESCDEQIDYISIFTFCFSILSFYKARKIPLLLPVSNLSACAKNNLHHLHDEDNK
ncbi:hypothetical protein BGC07_14430 [Piscirickettsia litoralis]|uniref:Uncharacterized protein n=1 Tax=Piscirickettsia litoralis TaxID=1891921 RepID=A0ABX3A4S5_9GAMM|nr:hypothetical protein BGC07_14430 [Piscirickettsia litoralis]